MTVGSALRLTCVALLAAAFGCSSGRSGSPTGDLGAVLTDGGTGTDGVAMTVPDGALATCHSDRECPGRVCDRGRLVCVDCLAASDCPSGQVCQASRCVTVTHCTSSRMCPGQLCDTALGFCVDCVGDTDCPMGQVCRTSSCVMPPRMCRSSRECTDINQVCDTAHGQCVDCVGDNDCAAGQYCRGDYTCQVQACAPNSTRCADGTHAQTCSARGSEYVSIACSSGQSCRGDHCQAWTCTPGAANCTDMNTRAVCNPDGGGTTSTPCAATESCSGGVCMTRSCAAGTATCADLNTRAVCNPDGLGQTGTPCGASQSCVGGACVAWVCTPGNAACTDTNTRSVCNPDGLGSTAAVCGAMTRCVAGACMPLVCTPGSSHCVDARTVQACSADGTSLRTVTCPAASTCSGTTCSSWVCTPGMATCATASTLTTCNPDGLASTTAPCPLAANAAAASCAAGACGFICNAGYGDCDLLAGDGCESPLATDLANCGACGHACPARPSATISCTAGACGFACTAGHADCDGSPSNGCEVSTGTDAANCGACRHACPTGQVCTAGSCTAGVMDIRTYVTTTPVPASVTFIDVCGMSGVTSELATIDDGMGPSATMPFSFRFFDGTYTQVTPSADGYLGFGATGTNWGRYGSFIIPDTTTTVPRSAFFVYSVDLFQRGGVCFTTVGTAPGRSLVWEENDARLFADTTSHLTWEVFLNEGSNTIDVIYQTITGPGTSGDTTLVGMQNADATRSYVFEHNVAGTVSSGLRLRFTPSSGP